MRFCQLFFMFVLYLPFSVDAQVKFELNRLPKEDQEKFDRKKDPDVFYVELSYGGYDIVNPQILKELDNRIVQKIEFVYTAFPEDFDYTELNNKRFASLYLAYPEIFNKPWIDWKIIRQTSSKSAAEASRLFHGFAVHTKKGAVLNAQSDVPAAIKQKIAKLSTEVSLVNPVPLGSLQNFLSAKSIKVSKLTFNGKATNLALFEEKEGTMKIVKGLLMTTGDVKNAVGPNYTPAATTVISQNLVVDKDMQKMVGKTGRLFDICKVEFDIEVDADSLFFDYCFGSEEYPEFLEFNDAFGLFISGTGINGMSEDTTLNIATLPRNKTLISVKNINHTKNEKFYVSNDYERDLHFFKAWQYDGFTVPVRAAVKIKRGQKYHFKLAIADFGDPYYDSGIFIRGFATKSK